MIDIRWQRVGRFLLAVLLAVLVSQSWAGAADQDVVFTIDPTQSTFQYSTVGGIYGTYVPVSPGSDTSTVSGHFLVNFDPLTDTPTSIQFVGGDGYYQQDSPMIVQSASPGVIINYTGLSWDFSSPVLSGAAGVYPANTTGFNVLSGGLTETFTNNSSEFFPATPYQDTVTAGQWTLAESGGPGSGDWTLSISGHYTEPAGAGPRSSTGTFTLNAVSTAHFGMTNITSVAPNATQASVLGGRVDTRWRDDGLKRRHQRRHVHGPADSQFGRAVAAGARRGREKSGVRSVDEHPLRESADMDGRLYRLANRPDGHARLPL